MSIINSWVKMTWAGGKSSSTPSAHPKTVHPKHTIPGVKAQKTVLVTWHPPGYFILVVDVPNFDFSPHYPTWPVPQLSVLNQGGKLLV